MGQKRNLRTRFLTDIVVVAAISLHLSVVADTVGPIELRGTFVPGALEIYKDLSKQQLLVSSEVRRIHAEVSVFIKEGTDREKAIKDLENALRDQARVVITKLYSNVVSVTYNDALPSKSNSPPSVREPSPK